MGLARQTGKKIAEAAEWLKGLPQWATRGATEYPALYPVLGPMTQYVTPELEAGGRGFVEETIGYEPPPIDPAAARTWALRQKKGLVPEAEPPEERAQAPIARAAEDVEKVMGDVGDVGVTPEEAVKPPDPAVGAQKMTTVEMPSGDEGGFIKATFPTGGVRNLGAFDPSLPQNQIARFHIPGQRDEYVRPIARAAEPEQRRFPPPGIQDGPTGPAPARGWAETPIPRSQQMRSARLFREREADVQAQRGIAAAEQAARLAELEDIRQDPRGIKAAAAERALDLESRKAFETHRQAQALIGRATQNRALQGQIEAPVKEYLDEVGKLQTLLAEAGGQGEAGESAAARIGADIVSLQQAFMAQMIPIYAGAGEEFDPRLFGIDPSFF
jgi:hypothetical protein